jgi:hypothetical protein
VKISSAKTTEEELVWKVLSDISDATKTPCLQSEREVSTKT